MRRLAIPTRYCLWVCWQCLQPGILPSSTLPEAKFENTICIAGKIKLKEELLLISPHNYTGIDMMIV
jgi:hypothetical protein